MKLKSMLRLLVGASVIWSSSHPMAWAKCTDELTQEARTNGKQRSAATAGLDDESSALDPRAQLQSLASEATKRSAELGASRLLAEASVFDVKETMGGRYPTVTINGGAGAGGSEVNGAESSRGMQASVGMNVNGTLMDWGRLSRMTEYRSGLADSAKFGADNLREQVVLEAVSTAIERNRYRVQAQVYQQYVRKMSCLVEALEQIVAEDRGRTSELVQARKTQAQAEISRDAAIAQGRQIELKLRKLIGDQIRLSSGITVPLTQLPELGEINRQIESSNDVRQLRAQSEAMDSYAKAVLAGQKPQFNWGVSKTASKLGSTKTSGWQAGVTVSYTLFNGYSDQAAAMAASRRADAARQQLAGLISTRTSRVLEIYDVATSSMEQARRYVEVLRESDRVRGFTFQQWSQLGKRSLFDLMSAESDHFNLRVAYVNALHDGVIASAQLRSLGAGLATWLAVSEQ